MVPDASHNGRGSGAPGGPVRRTRVSPLASVRQPGPAGRAVFRGILRPVPGYAYCSTDDVQGVVIHEFQACCPRFVGGGVRHGGRRRRLSGCAPERDWNNCRSYAESERDRHAGGPARDRNGSARNPRRCHKACFGRSAAIPRLHAERSTKPEPVRQAPAPTRAPVRPAENVVARQEAPARPNGSAKGPDSASATPAGAPQQPGIHRQRRLPR